MKETTRHRVAIALAAAGLAVLVVLLGNALVPAKSIAEARGIVPQWIVTWTLIWMTAGAAAVLAGLVMGSGVIFRGHSQSAAKSSVLEK